MFTSELKKLLRDEVLLNFGAKHGKNSLTVTERQNLKGGKTKKGRLGKFTILDLPPESVAFKLESSQLENEFTKEGCRNFSWLIDSNDGDDVGKRSDFVLVVPMDNSINVILGELKSKDFTVNECQIQLENTFLISRYIFELIDVYNLKNNIEKAYKLVIISNSFKKIDNMLSVKSPISSHTGNVPLDLKNGSIKVSLVKVRDNQNISYSDLCNEIRRNTKIYKYVKLQ